jgi:hypothetical protein
METADAAHLLLLQYSGGSKGANLRTTIGKSSINDKLGGDQQQYQLARDQSFGFFDDVSEAHWRRAQEIHKQMFPNHYSSDLMKYSNGPQDKGSIPKLKYSSYWNGENFHVEFHCPLAQRLPTDGQADGPKWVCDPHRLKTQEDCLIYSFGSNGKAEFEKAVKEYIGDHCEGR